MQYNARDLKLETVILQIMLRPQVTVGYEPSFSNSFLGLFLRHVRKTNNFRVIIITILTQQLNGDCGINWPLKKSIKFPNLEIHSQ